MFFVISHTVCISERFVISLCLEKTLKPLKQ
jgi:hypothetical protein